MRATNECQRRYLLATGAILGTAGAAGIIIPLITGVPDAMGPLAFPVGFLVGLSAGLGATLSLLNLKA